MHADLKRGKAAFRTRNIGLSVAILASATLSLSAPDRALAACGGSSHPAGIHTGVASGVHVATSATATAGGTGGGVGSLGCAGGSSATALRGLPTAASGRVMQTGAHAARTERRPRTATTRTANAAVHAHALGHGRRT
jgi:hypothetical protein